MDTMMASVIILLGSWTPGICKKAEETNPAPQEDERGSFVVLWHGALTFKTTEMLNVKSGEGQ